ncbi:MAG TPA: DUF4446 family protein [Patescibacteria group bacterium]
MLTILFFVIAFLIVIWIAMLTVFFWSLSSHYNNLVKSTNKKTLQGILDSLILDVDSSKKDIVSLQKQCDTIVTDGSFHIQKIGLLRFNPFKDTGGDQSFILALLDGNDTGVVISGLYSRAGTRWYSKRVSKGKGVDHELSDEEKKTLKEAKGLN